ncbi:MAG: radical SAM protein [Planctomycetota bacterium]|nr:radical SAM protein [Planctomycetota bacterium]
MLSLSRLLCGLRTESDPLRYGHARQGSHGAANDAAPKPVVVWALTRACNLRCVHCYAAASSKPASSELTHAEGRALLEDLRDFGVPAVLFSGGEPLVRHDALDLLDYARGLGLNATLSTNGLLIDDAMADKLADLELKYVGISLDGLKPIHDKLRGQPGAYEETLAAIRRCRERGIKVGLRYTVHALNLDQLDAVFDLCLDLGIQRLCVYHLAYAGRGRSLRRSDLSSECTRAMVERLMRRTIEAHEAGSRMEVLTVANHADAALLLLWFERHLPEFRGGGMATAARHRRQPFRLQYRIHWTARNGSLRSVQLALHGRPRSGKALQLGLDACARSAFGCFA